MNDPIDRSAPRPAEDVPAMELTLPSAQDLVRPEGEAPSPLATAHRVLRGRYPFALGLGAVLAVAGLVLGFLLPRPLYKSVGVIDVAPKVPRVLYDSDEKGLLPMFDNYVASQARLATTRRVIDRAMASPEWKKFGRGHSDAEIARFQNRLLVEHPKFTQHIEVSFEDEDPDAAQVAVNEVIAAFMEIVAERDTDSETSKVRLLESRRTLANSKLQELRTDVQSVTDELGEQALEARYHSTVEYLNSLDTLLHELDVEIATTKASHDAVGTIVRRPPTEQEIALKDGTMAQLLADRAAIETRVGALARDFGAANPDLATARQQLDSISKRIQAHADAVRAAWLGTPDARALELKEKESRRAELASLRDSVFEETRKLGRKKGLLANLEWEHGLQTETLDDVKKRLEQIQVESSLHSRITVISYGDLPVEPDTDRRIPLAVLGAGGGIALGFGTILLWGIREGKLRHVVDVNARTSHGRFLGVLPDVEEPAADDEGDEPVDMSDFCVHHIRTMLQLRRARSGRGGAVAITSPMPGAGKTTLGLALGASYAAAGSRTLLVDCDFVGRGLTSAVRALVCQSVRQALPGPDAASPREVRRGIVAAIVGARKAGCSESDALAALATARTRTDAGDAAVARLVPALEQLVKRRDGAPGPKRGVLGVLSGRDLSECVIETGIRKLDLLPATDAGQQDGDCLSRGPLELLLATCRDAYDVVVVDTGPMLGSIEAAVAAAVADSVVLVVSRGDRGPNVDDAIARVEGIGADIAGIVFNRASPKDVAKSNHASRSSTVAA
jgi:polysaccharide biosynthesis transport protein